MNDLLTLVVEVAAGVLVGAWVAYFIWLVLVLLASRKPKPEGAMFEGKWYQGSNADTIKRITHMPPYDMADLEKEVQWWRLTNKPGSVGAASVGLELIDDHLD